MNRSRYLRQPQKYLTYWLAVRLRGYRQKDFCSANCVTNICFYYFLRNVESSVAEQLQNWS